VWAPAVGVVAEKVEDARDVGAGAVHVNEEAGREEAVEDLAWREEVGGV
jgi:hypothetical protein